MVWNPRAPVAAAILAGGRARRMGGTRKWALVVDGARIIDRQLAALAGLADPVLIVAPDPAPFAGLPARVVADRVAGAGALGGIYTAVAESPHDRVLVLACDLPFVSRAWLQRLVDASTEGIDAVVPRTARGREPLCAVYAKGCEAPIAAQLRRGDLRAAHLPDGLRVRELGPETLAEYDPDGLLFVNVNTPHDYARARARIQLKSEPPTDRITEDDSPDSPARP
ncbi:MAG TPA: molybdenum cofactor guanylyltransferase [Vicinamibacterales bacterium]|nr:molybdenum cofactor guanylyltransferase [Vicinamibacterales bacterium]